MAVLGPVPVQGGAGGCTRPLRSEPPEGRTWLRSCRQLLRAVLHSGVAETGTAGRREGPHWEAIGTALPHSKDLTAVAPAARLGRLKRRGREGSWELAWEATGGAKRGDGDSAALRTNLALPSSRGSGGVPRRFRSF